MSFSDSYANILSPFVENYKEAKNERERKIVIQNAADAVSESHSLREGATDDLPKDLQRVITRYIKALIEKESTKEAESSKPKKVKQVYVIRDVIKKLYREEIDAQIPYTSTDKRYISYYQAAVTTILNNMSNDELEKAESILESWKDEGVPQVIQLKKAKTKLPTEIQNKVNEWKVTSGALVMCLVAYSDGKDVKGFHVESSPNIGNSFTNSCKDWKNGTYENFKDWALKQFNFEKLGSEDEADVPVDEQKAKDLKFDRNDDEDFVLPPKSDFKTIRQKQRVIRGYIGAVYRDFTGYRKAAFPYVLAAEEGQTIYSSASVPEGFILRDPDHLKLSEVDALYNHWLRRQSKGLTPLVILNSNPQHVAKGKKKMSEKAKGKKKIKYVHVDSGDDDVADEDEKSGAEEERSSDNERGRKHLEGKIFTGVKFGPPRGIGPMNKAPTDEAGPSNKGQPKKPKKRNIQQSTSMTGVVDGEVQDEDAPAKRKRNEETEESPSKRRRKVDAESTPEVPQKRKIPDPDESPSKRPRRENKRVKDFPAGNVTTSGSRIAFLKTLCKIPKFLSMVDLVLAVPKPSPIPTNFPSWASWKSHDKFLPAIFHKSAIFNKTLSIAANILKDSSTFEEGKIDPVLLLVGLMYREVSRAMEMEPGGDNDGPEHLKNSSFGIQQMKKIETLIEAVVLPS